jgi:hypothetical protein
MPIFTQYTCLTSKTGDQLKALIDTQTNDPQMINQRIIDVLTGINGGQISGNISLAVNPTQSSYRFNLTQQPSIGNTITLFGVTLTCSNTSSQNTFTIGGNLAQTALGLSLCISNNTILRQYCLCAFGSGANPQILIIGYFIGPGANIQSISTTIPGIIFPSPNVFSGASAGVTTSIALGIASSAPTISNDFKVTIYSNDTQASMLQTLNMQQSSPSQTLINLINLHNSFSYRRPVYMNTQIGATPYTAQLILLNNIQAGQTLTIGTIVFTCVASGGSGASFNLGVDLLTTAQNLYQSIINTSPDALNSSISTTIDTSRNPSLITFTFTAKTVGSALIGVPIATNFLGAILSPFTGTEGTLSGQKLGLNDNRNSFLKRY